MDNRSRAQRSWGILGCILVHMKINFRIFSVTLLIFAVILFIPQISKLIIRKQEWITVRAITTSERFDSDGHLPVYYWRIDNLKNGDEERSPSGKVVAKLNNIEIYQEGPKKIAIVDISLLASYNAVTKHFRYKTQELLAGTNLDLNLGDNHLVVQLTEINPPERKKKIIRVEGIISWQKKWFADAIRIGDVYTDYGSDRTPAKVIGKKVVIPEEKILNERDMLNRHLFWDIRLTLDLEVDEMDGIFYFFSVQPVKVGNSIYVPMEKYNLYNISVTRVDVIE